MPNPSPFLAPSRPSNHSREESGRSLAELIDGAAVAILGVVLRWIEQAECSERERVR